MVVSTDSGSVRVVDPFPLRAELAERDPLSSLNL